jgi:hypothetical protein
VRSARSALVKGHRLAEAVTSLIAYFVLYLLAAWGARTFADDSPIVTLFRFYGLFLLANLVYETSVGVLQSTDNFKQVARANFLPEHRADGPHRRRLPRPPAGHKLGLTGILAAYLVGKTIAGVMVTGSRP